MELRGPDGEGLSFPKIRDELPRRFPDEPTPATTDVVRDIFYREQSIRAAGQLEKPARIPKEASAQVRDKLQRLLSRHVASVERRHAKNARGLDLAWVERTARAQAAIDRITAEKPQAPAESEADEGPEAEPAAETTADRIRRELQNDEGPAEAGPQVHPS